MIKITLNNLNIASEQEYIASGGVESIPVFFNFSGEWDGWSKTAIFYQESGERIFRILGEGNATTIPGEALDENSTLYIGVFGTANGAVKSSGIAAVYVDAGAYDGMPPEPTPDVYAQILALVEQYRQDNVDVYESEDARKAAEIDRESAESLRATAEADRATEEGLRVSAESDRETAEGLRESAEADRVTAEGLRNTAEIDRNTAEGLRVSAESDRETAETARENAETARSVFEEWDGSTAYVVGNKVAYEGSSYRCIADNAGELPTNTDYWLLIAEKGEQGIQGIPGGDITTADELPIVDSGEYFESGNVEGALQEIGADIDTLGTEVLENTTAINEKTSYGVLSGLIIGSVDIVGVWGVECSPGVVYTPDGVRHSISQKVSNDIPVTPPDATYDRIDIIYVSSAGEVICLAGTPAETPVQPATPTGGVLLATLLVQTTDTHPKSPNITNNPKRLGRSEWITPTLINGATSVTSYPVQYAVYDNGIVRFRGQLSVAPAGLASFTMPSGYRPAKTTEAVCATGTSINFVKCTFYSGGNFICPTTFSNYLSLENVSYSRL